MKQEKQGRCASGKGKGRAEHGYCAVWTKHSLVVALLLRNRVQVTVASSYKFSRSLAIFGRPGSCGWHTTSVTAFRSNVG